MRYNKGVSARIRKLLFSSLLALAGLFFSPQVVFAQCAAGQIDLAEYMIQLTPQNEYSMRLCSPQYPSASQPIHFETGEFPGPTAPDTPPAGINPVIMYKGTDYELYGADSNYVYFFEDISWDHTCNESGNRAFYRVYDPASNSWGGKYPRCVSPGQDITLNMRIGAFERAPYVESGATPQACTSQYAGDASITFRVDFVEPGEDELAPTIPGSEGQTIRMQGVGGAGSDESRYFTKGYGLTGFVHFAGDTVDFHATFDSGEQTTELACNKTSDLDFKNVLIYPNPEREPTAGGVPTDQTPSDTLWRRYLSNTQVYCSPRQVYLSTEANPPNMQDCREASDLGPQQNGGDVAGDNVCGPFEFPVVQTDSTLDVQRMTFPLFRDNGGSISIEADLSRVNPNDTFVEAARRNAKPEYAPQFYLTMPETQCINAVRYAEYVKNACDNFYQDGGDDKRCGADINVTLPAGNSVSILELKNQVLGSEDVCSTYDPTDEESLLTQAIRSIQPHTPRVFKMGFVVQHTFTHDPNLPLQNQFSTDLNIVQKIITWFRGQDESSIGLLDGQPGEKLDIIPVWYHVGMAATSFDYNQTQRSYNVNPDNSYDQPLYSPIGDFSGALWQGYLPAMQPEHYSFLSNVFIHYVLGNSHYMQFMARHFQEAGGLDWQDKLIFTPADTGYVPQNPYDHTSYAANQNNELRYPLPCLDGRSCFCFGEGNNEVCVNQSEDELAQYFPDLFEPNSEYLNALRRQIVYRINSGVQSTFRDPQGIIEFESGNSWTEGSVSMRNFGDSLELCALDQENKRHGYQEEVKSIGSSAIQVEVDQAEGDTETSGDDEENPVGSTNPVYKIVSELRAKVMGWGGRSSLAEVGTGEETDMIKKRVDITYLILPDDAMKIGIMQNTLLRMFLSPESYKSIINGENPILPIREEWEAEEAGSLPGGWDPIVSAHLRVNGVDRSVEADAEGYVRVSTVQYAIEGDCAGEGGCSCGGTVVSRSEPQNWIPKDDLPDSSPSPENGCVGYEVAEENFVGVRGDFEGETPDERPETPGQVFALFEYVRRMAFTPLHMQPYDQYPGLEEFYRGGIDQSRYNPSTQAVPDSCVYTPRTIDVQDEYGYSSNLQNPAEDPFRNEICQVESASGVPGEYLRAILEIEASPFLRAVRGAGSGQYNPSATSFICGANPYGAVGPMSLVVGECSSRASTQGFSNAENSLSPDLCTIEGAMSAAANLVRQHQSVVRRTGSLYEYYEALAERYLGVGSCGELGVRNDGAPAYSGGPDYCAYVADRATGKFANYCSL